MRLARKIGLGAIAALIVTAAILIVIVVSQWQADQKETQQERANGGSTASRDGQGFWYWLMVGIDKTVGLPEPKPSFPDEALVAAAFLDLIEGGEPGLALDLTSGDFQTKSSAEALQVQDAHTIKNLGARDAADGKRKWSKAETGKDSSVRLVYYRNHEKGSSKTEVVVRKLGNEFLVDEWTVTHRHFRMKR
jgi:hypothetical protein